MTGGGVTAGIDFGLALIAELAGDATAEAIQLNSNTPAPPFEAGEPDTAPREVLDAVGKRMAPILAERGRLVAEAANGSDSAADGRAGDDASCGTRPSRAKEVPTVIWKEFMPIYAYRCRDCGKEFSTLVLSGETPACRGLRERRPRAAAFADRHPEQGRRSAPAIGLATMMGGCGCARGAARPSPTPDAATPLDRLPSDRNAAILTAKLRSAP